MLAGELAAGAAAFEGRFTGVDLRAIGDFAAALAFTPKGTLVATQAAPFRRRRQLAAGLGRGSVGSQGEDVIGTERHVWAVCRRCFTIPCSSVETACSVYAAGIKYRHPAPKEKPRLHTEASAWRTVRQDSQLCVTAARQAASSRTRLHPVRRHRRYCARLGQHSPPYMLPPIPELWVWRVPPSSTNSCCALQLTCFDHGAQVTVQANDNRCDLMHYPRAKNLICSTIHTWAVQPSPAAASSPSGAPCGAQRTRDRKAVPASERGAHAEEHACRHARRNDVNDGEHIQCQADRQGCKGPAYHSG